MNFNYFLFSFCLFLVYNCLESNFEVIYKNNLEENKLIKYLNNNFVQIDLSFGSNNQNFKSIVLIDKYYTSVLGKQINDFPNLKKFDNTSSNTFNYIQNCPNIQDEFFYQVYLGEDTIKIGETESIKNIKFFIISTLAYNRIFTSAFIGLSPEENNIINQLNVFNIIDQLKNSSAINKRIWYLEFNDLNKGKFVIGKYPHEVNSNKYNEKNMLTSNLNREKYYSPYYAIEFNEIYYGNLNNFNERTILKNYNNSVISLSTNLIISTFEYYNFIYNKYFLQKIRDNICYSGKLGEEYQYFYCHKDKIKISDIDNLNFYIRNNNKTFTLESKELFYEYNNYLYYLVLFPNDDNLEFKWTLGLSFLKKYTLVFNRGDKLVHYYKSTEDNNGETNNSNNSTIYIIIIVCLCIIFICCITFLIFYIIKIKPRKTKANELDDGFDYETKDNNENGNNPLMSND